MIQIKRAHQGHLNELVHLFDAYSMFYKKESNLDGAKHFLSERINNFCSLTGRKTCGIYPVISLIFFD